MMRVLPLPCLILLSLAACGGGSAPGPALPVAQAEAPAARRILSYVNPPPSGFRLEVDPATNHSPRLILHLKGPEGLPIRGLGIFLAAGQDQVAWARAGSGNAWFRSGGVLEPGPGEPRLARDRVEAGLLQVGLFQREGAAVAVGTTPLLSVVLEPAPEAMPGKASLGVPADRRGVLLDDARNLLELPLGIGSLEVR